MARWVCFGEVELGRLTARDRADAERHARHLFGDRCVRVQSVLSLEAAESDTEAVRMRHRRDPWDAA